MGCCTSSPEQLASKNLDRVNAKEAAQEKAKIKLLLLGAGESGKSTIFKQMKLLYGQGFTMEEKKYWSRIIRENATQAMAMLCRACIAFGLDGAIGPDASGAFFMMRELPDRSVPVPGDKFTREHADAIKVLWADGAIQQTWARRSETQVIERNQLYFAKIDEIEDAAYVPTDEDIIASRVRTCGIVEEHYLIDGVDFVILDVGGQKSERRKWMHAFEGVNAIIFVAAISEFDQTMFEDASANRMVDSIELFDTICNSETFRETPIMLFLNKRDLFDEKIANVSIADVPSFADYAAVGRPNSYDDGVAYFVEKFRARNQRNDRDVYSHVTCATDSTNVRVVFNTCKDIILKESIKMSGFV